MGGFIGHHLSRVQFNTFAVTAKLSRQLMCIVRCHWQVYSSFSTLNPAIHRHHSR